MIAEKSSQSIMNTQIPYFLKVSIVVIFLLQIFTITLCGYLLYDGMKIKTELSMYKSSVKMLSDPAIDHTSERRGSESRFDHLSRSQNWTEFAPDVQIKQDVHSTERRKVKTKRSIAELCARIFEEASGKEKVGELTRNKTRELASSSKKPATRHRTKRRTDGLVPFADNRNAKQEISLITSSGRADSTFIQWGSFGCNKGEKFFDGYAVAFRKGASTIHCVPSSNLFGSGSASLLNGPKLDTLRFDMQGINNPSLASFDNELIRCAMCQAKLTEIITITGWSSCNADGNTKWTTIYPGFVMTTETTGQSVTRSEPICMKTNPAEADHIVIDSQAPRLKAVRSGSGVWTENKLVPCVVCAKLNLKNHLY